MFLFILVLIWLGLSIYEVYKWMFYRPQNFPPGPPRLPILGAYPYLLLLNYRHLHKAIDWLCKYYRSNVIGFYAAQFPTIVANTTGPAKELLINRNLDGKPQLTLAKIRDPDCIVRGLFFTEGPLWHEQRRFTLRYLRDFGFGRRHGQFELELNAEILNLIDLIRNGPKYDFEKKYHNDNNVLVPYIFAPTFGNFFMKIVLNERLPRDKMYMLYEAAVHAIYFTKKGDDWGRMFSYAEFIPKYFSKWSEYDVLRESLMNYHRCIKSIVDDQYKRFDPTHERHFLDLYFKKIKETKNDPDSTYSYEQLILVTGDMFIPSFAATSTTMQFLLQRLYLQPDILIKCQKEIDYVVGHSRLPNLDDRVNLPYIEATIRESMRYDTLVPSGLPHTATADTKFMGYDIPKGAIIFSSLYGSHKDDSTWTKPECFMPERFLDDNGQFSAKLDKSLPFGAGKRICAGETFARNVIFLVFSAIIQHFNIVKPQNKNMPDPSKTHTGIIQSLPEYWLTFLERQNADKNIFNFS